MNKQTQKSVYADHDDVLMLLPWYASGSLTGGELDRVRDHLKVCLTCRRELASTEFLAQSLEREPAMEISYKPSFERLMARIRQEEQTESMRQARPPRVSWLSSLAGWASELLAPKYLVPALATVTMATVIPFMLRDGGLGHEEVPAYQTLAMPGSMAKFPATTFSWCSPTARPNRKSPG
jgi:hypothetical protein